MPVHRASCHCGNTRLEFEADITEGLACNCSMCQRRGSLLWFMPRAELQVLDSQPSATYRFHTHKIAHHFCPICGIHTWGEGTAPDGTLMAAINLRCVEDLDLTAVPIKHFDGRSA